MIQIKSNILTIAVVRALGIALIGAGILSCAPDELIFGLPRLEVETMLARGEYEFLLDIDWGDYTPRIGARPEPGISFYLAHILDHLELEDYSDDLLRAEWRRGEDPWRYQAGLLLAERITERKHWAALWEVARKGVMAYPDDVDWHYHYMHAAYRLERDKRLLALFDDYFARLEGENDNLLWHVRRRQAEAILWRAVAAQRSGHPQWRRFLEDMFMDYSASEFHVRVYLYLRANPQIKEAFPQWMQDFFTAKYHVAGEEYDAGDRPV